MSNYDQVYFQQINTEETPQAERLADVLTWHYNPKSVIDIGCASGLYLKPFLDKGVRVVGIDYSESVLNEAVLQIPKRYIKLADFTKTAPVTHVDLAMCIEVLEHIPVSKAKKAVKYISQCANTIFFTAAAPGQGGVGHINCQPKEYWQDLFEQHSFERDLRDEDYIRSIMLSGYHMGWLTNNMMIFKKKIREN